MSFKSNWILLFLTALVTLTGGCTVSHWNHFSSINRDVAPSAKQFGLEVRCLVGDFGHRDKEDSSFHIVPVVVINNDSLCSDSTYWESLIIEDFRIFLPEGKVWLKLEPIPEGKRNAHVFCKKAWEFGKYIIPHSEDSIRVEFNVFANDISRDHPVKYKSTKVRYRETTSQPAIWLWGDGG